MKRRKRISSMILSVLSGMLLLGGCGMESLGSAPEPPAESAQTTADTAESTAGTAAPETTVSSSPDTTAQTTLPVSSDTAAQSGSTASETRRTGTAATNHTSGGTTAATEPAQPVDLNALVSGMTLEQKAAQMMLVGITDEADARSAAKYGVGALCMFAKPFTGKTKQQVRTMLSGIQKQADIPLIISADEEGRPINRVSLNPKLRAVPFWNGKALYESGGWDLVISDTKEKAELLLDLGVNVNLAPVADVPLTWDDYIANRCFSLDPAQTAEYIRRVVTEMKADGLGSTLKHFPGYGGSVDTHKNMGYDDRAYSAFENGDFLPFIAGIQAGADAVMVSHNIVRCMDSEQPASLSPAVHEILRQKLGFTGVVISDDLGMDAIKQFTGGKNPAVAAVLAGNDLVAYADYKTSVKAIADAVRGGTIPESQIDASVLRILRWKQSLGLI